MTINGPHVLLFSEATSLPVSGEPPGSRSRPIQDASRRFSPQFWHFVLRSSDGRTQLDVADQEEGVSASRLELLAVVRGLEALDQPSRVTLVTSSRSIQRGLRFGLELWRENGWQWERFGQMTPIKNADLWRRIDRALAFHDVHCRVLRFDPPADDLRCPVPKSRALAGPHQRPVSPAVGACPAAGSRGRRAISVAAQVARAWRIARGAFSWNGLVQLMRAMPIPFGSSNCDAVICR
ncbi:MAG: RNase H family protein [Planctomycetota bacterium]